MSRGRSRVEIDAWIVGAAMVMVAAVALLVFGLIVHGNRTTPTFDPVTAAGPAAATTSAPARRVLVIGDSYTGGSDQGGNGPASWSSLVTDQLHQEGYDVTVDVSAGGGSGYVQVGTAGFDFRGLADKYDANQYDLVVFFGSRNDSPDKGDVQAAAASDYADVKASSPNAALLVIGPPWVDDAPPSWIVSDRDAVSAAALTVGATFVDPLADGWFTGDKSALIGGDGVHPTDAGHQYMAGLIEPVMRAALDALPVS